jgi:hypothetical protein
MENGRNEKRMDLKIGEGKRWWRKKKNYFMCFLVIILSDELCIIVKL